ncbi:RtcB family protein [Muribaculum intestinale]|jgi:hypothetical protein|uniref:RtcB family protein n=1 Tax=Muribaculum intestinale TaxID=1796646 RepID=UPI001093CD9B|nr:RtcB family protein [Muribaculum intestinale]TGX86544.1 hypothetical protein E5360_04340 [Muribaculum intestinale]
MKWIAELCDHPAMEGVPVVQMPDVHADSLCNVGAVYPVAIYVNPDHVGAEIGCMISMRRLSCIISPADFALLDHRIREAVPTGSDICIRNSVKSTYLLWLTNLPTKYFN